MSELKQFRLPDVGEGLTEAEILHWYVSVGETVTTNQTIVEVETAKAAVELPCPFDGVVARLHVDEGQTVDVGTPIITVDVAPADSGAPPSVAPGTAAPGSPPAGAGPAGGEPVITAPAADRPSPVPVSSSVGPVRSADTPGGGREAVLVGYGVRKGTAVRRPRRKGPASGSVAESLPGGFRIGVLAKPPVRKLARDLGVDIGSVVASGTGGVVTRDDVRAAAAVTSPPALTVAAPPVREREERVTVRGVRKAIAEAMVRSAFTAPHVTVFVTVEVSRSLQLVEKLRGLPEFEGVKVSPLVLVARALLLAVRRHPQMNATWDEAAGEIVLKRYVNLGVAAATARGLVVPNIKDAQDLTLSELARALDNLVRTARDGRSTPADLTGGTVTISNIGVFGVDAGTPILNPGEAAILAVGSIAERPWVVKDAAGRSVIEPRPVVTLAASFDHRMIDGELGSRFVADVAAVLEDPELAVAWS